MIRKPACRMGKPNTFTNRSQRSISRGNSSSVGLSHFSPVRLPEPSWSKMPKNRAKNPVRKAVRVCFARLDRSKTRQPQAISPQIRSPADSRK